MSGIITAPICPCWCALDDMSIENGTVYILPYSRDGRASADDITDHEVEARSNDKVGYRGADPGEPAIVPAGSIVVFSSRTFHRSGANMSDKYRRSYLAQYSAEPIMNRDGSELWGRAEAILIDGAFAARRRSSPSRLKQRYRACRASPWAG